MSGDPRAPGPLDEAKSPQQLTAHVVDPGPPLRVHGYDVEEDIAVHYSVVEQAMLCLTGELPTLERSRCAEIALSFFAPTCVNEAPTHAAVASRLCGATSSAIIGVGAVTLAEQAHAFVMEHLDLLALLDRGEREVSSQFLATSEVDRGATSRLRAGLSAAGVDVPVLNDPPVLSRSAAVFAALHFSGLTRPEQLETVIVACRLPSVVAEALSWRTRAFRDYPTNLPAFHYEDEL